MGWLAPLWGRCIDGYLAALFRLRMKALICGTPSRASGGLQDAVVANAFDFVVLLLGVVHAAAHVQGGAGSA
jgi:hypothetical protein